VPYRLIVSVPSRRRAVLRGSSLREPSGASGRVGIDQVADRPEIAADLTVDGRPHLAPIVVQLRVDQGSFSTFHLALGLVANAQGFGKLLVADGPRVRFPEPDVHIVNCLLLDQCGLGHIQTALGRIEGRLVRPLARVLGAPASASASAIHLGYGYAAASASRTP
jgi:hypothetical protein